MLFISVLDQALCDAAGDVEPVGESKQTFEAVRRNARRWLLRPSSDLDLIASSAGLEMEYVIRSARRIIADADKKGIPYRSFRSRRVTDNEEADDFELFEAA